MRIGPLDWALVVLVSALGALVCAVNLSGRSLWLDEGATLSIASQHGAALWSAISHDGGNMLVYYVVLHFVIAIFGEGVVALRMLSVIADAATAGLVALLALALFTSRGVALVAGALSAVSVGLVFWGQDARGYAIMVTAASASFYALVVILRSDPRRPPPPAAVLGYVLATALSLYIGFDAVLLIPGQLLVAVALRRRVVTVVSCLIVVAALSVPLLVLAINRGSGQLFWVPPLSATVAWQTLATLVSAGLPPNFHTTVWTVAAASVSTVMVVLSGVLAWRSRWESGQAALILVPLSWLVVPLGLGLLGALAGEPLELARISILSMPALSLLLAWALVGPRAGLAAVPGRLGSASLSLPLGLAGLAVILALRLIVLVPSYHATPEPWKAVAARVLARSRPRDCIAFYPEDGRMPFGYYVRQAGAAHRAPRALLPAESWYAQTPHVETYVRPTGGEIPALTAGCSRLWLLASHQGQRHGTAQSRRNYAGYVALQRELAVSYPHHSMGQFGWASPIRLFLYRR